jgi:hypothetical protein
VLLEELGLSGPSSMKSRSASSKATESLYGVTVPLGGIEKYPGGGVSGCGSSVTELDLLWEPRFRTSLRDWRSDGSEGRRFDTTVGSTLYNMLSLKLLSSIPARIDGSKVVADKSARSARSILFYRFSVAVVAVSSCSRCLHPRLTASGRKWEASRLTCAEFD